MFFHDGRSNIFVNYCMYVRTHTHMYIYIVRIHGTHAVIDINVNEIKTRNSRRKKGGGEG